MSTCDMGVESSIPTPLYSSPSLHAPYESWWSELADFCHGTLLSPKLNPPWLFRAFPPEQAESSSSWSSGRPRRRDSIVMYVAGPLMSYHIISRYVMSALILTLMLILILEQNLDNNNNHNSNKYSVKGRLRVSCSGPPCPWRSGSRAVLWAEPCLASSSVLNGKPPTCHLRPLVYHRPLYAGPGSVFPTRCARLRMSHASCRRSYL
jgi:hypothetical protein